MDVDSSSKFISSLTKFLQSLCNGFVEFDRGVEIIGHIYLSVDSDIGKKINYVLDEKLCKERNTVTFISNSFHAQPTIQSMKSNEAGNSIGYSGVDSSEDSIWNSADIGIGHSDLSVQGEVPRGSTFSPNPKNKNSSSKRKGKRDRGTIAALESAQSPQPLTSSGSKIKKRKGSDADLIHYNGNIGDKTHNALAFFHSEAEKFGSHVPSYLSNNDPKYFYNSTCIDQKPDIIHPDLGIVKEEFLNSPQNNGGYSGLDQSEISGYSPDNENFAEAIPSAVPVMLHQTSRQSQPVFPSNSDMPELYMPMDVRDFSALSQQQHLVSGRRTILRPSNLYSDQEMLASTDPNSKGSQYRRMLGRLKDTGQLETWKKMERQRARNYRRSLTEEKKAVLKMKSRLRQRRYRERKLAQESMNKLAEQETTRWAMHCIENQRQTANERTTSSEYPMKTLKKRGRPMKEDKVSSDDCNSFYLGEPRLWEQEVSALQPSRIQACRDKISESDPSEVSAKTVGADSDNGQQDSDDTRNVPPPPHSHTTIDS